MNKIASKIWGFAVWGLIILLSLSVLQGINRSAQISAQIKAEKVKLAGIEAGNNKLQEELTETESPDFIEKEMRDKLGLGKAGEATVVLPDADSLRALAPQMPIEADSLPPPNWKKWENLFF